MDNEPTPSDQVAQKIRELRKLRNMTVTDLAERCAQEGMPRLTAQVLYKLEGQRTAPARARDVTVDELVVLARALEVAPAALVPFMATGGFGPVSLEQLRELISGLQNLAGFMEQKAQEEHGGGGDGKR